MLFILYIVILIFSIRGLRTELQMAVVSSDIYCCLLLLKDCEQDARGAEKLIPLYAIKCPSLCSSKVIYGVDPT